MSRHRPACTQVAGSRHQHRRVPGLLCSYSRAIPTQVRFLCFARVATAGPCRRFDAIGVVFIRPWWSQYVAEDGVARMFELEAVKATTTSLRPLFADDTPPAPVRPTPDSPQDHSLETDSVFDSATSLASLLRKNAAQQYAPESVASGGATGESTRQRLLITVPKAAVPIDVNFSGPPRDTKKIMLRFRRPAQEDDLNVVADGAVKRNPEHSWPKPPCAPISASAEEHFTASMHIALSLVDYADKHLRHQQSRRANVSPCVWTSLDLHLMHRIGNVEEPGWTTLFNMLPLVSSVARSWMFPLHRWTLCTTRTRC